MGNYETLISDLKTTLEGVTAIRNVYAYPETRIQEYPSIVFFPEGFNNEFESTKSNQKRYQFRVFIIVGTNQKDHVDIFSTVLPNAVDDVIAALDDAWDAGTINGHRATLALNSGTWTMAETENGLEATAELFVEITVLSSVS